MNVWVCGKSAYLCIPQTKECGEFIERLVVGRMCWKAGRQAQERCFCEGKKYFLFCLRVRKRFLLLQPATAEGEDAGEEEKDLRKRTESLNFNTPKEGEKNKNLFICGSEKLSYLCNHETNGYPERRDAEWVTTTDWKIENITADGRPQREGAEAEMRDITTGDPWGEPSKFF